MNFPTAQFWPGGLLPSGPDYAEPHAIDPTADIRTIGPAREFARKQSQAVWLAAMAAPPAPEFALEQTPEDIDAREMEPV
jgi:hypothetical protein